MRNDRVARSLRMRADAGTLLARALVADAAMAGLDCTVTAWRIHPWASATFVGCRHGAVVTLPEGPAAEAWLGSLAERDLALRGHLLAELTAGRRADGSVEIAALTIDPG